MCMNVNINPWAYAHTFTFTETKTVEKSNFTHFSLKKNQKIWNNYGINERVFREQSIACRHKYPAEVDRLISPTLRTQHTNTDDWKWGKRTTTTKTKNYKIWLNNRLIWKICMQIYTRKDHSIFRKYIHFDSGKCFRTHQDYVHIHSLWMLHCNC